MSSVLAADRLVLVRGSRLISSDLSISFSEGVTAILGPNGAGKTTLIETIMSPGVARGTIRLDDEEIHSHASLRTFFARVGHMPQAWQYSAGFSALESVEYVGWLKGIPSRQLRTAATTALAAVDLSAQADTKVRKLSGGMRQRVGLAEAFVNDPRVVLLDEPTVGLDPGQRAQFRRLLRARSTGRAVVLSTHLTDDVVAIADRVVVLSAGQILFDGSVAELSAAGGDGNGAASAVEAGYLSLVEGAPRDEGVD